MAIPESAQVVIVGGGITGASLLYHLAHEGWTDTLLVEKAELTSGSTWHAAGQVTHSVSSYTLGNFRKYACELYASLPEESGIATSWHKSGSFRIAYHDVEVDWLRAQLGVAEYVGNRMEWVDADFVKDIWPFFDTSEVQGAIHTPDDGHVDPTGATNAVFAEALAEMLIEAGWPEDRLLPDTAPARWSGAPPDPWSGEIPWRGVTPLGSDTTP